MRSILATIRFSGALEIYVNLKATLARATSRQFFVMLLQNANLTVEKMN